jgi:DNA transformation protein and related proteins
MSEFVDHVIELMAHWAPVRARRMFGGHGLYRESRMFALVFDDTLYMKADESTRVRFAAVGSAPFVYSSGDRRIELSYWRAPEVCLDETESMCVWCALAWEAAWRSASRPARNAKPARAALGAHAVDNTTGTQATSKSKAKRRPRR